MSRRARRVRTEVRDARRARIILAAAGGASNAAIARAEGVHVDTVRKWRSRFAERGVPGLRDLSRTGRPAVFGDTVVAEVKALACQLPAETGVPLSRWSHHELAAEATSRGIVDTVSRSTVRRWLDADAIKPWQHRSWIFPRDRDFAFKAGRVLGLYDRVWDGEPLGPDDYVISADEKSQLQALQRRHPGLPPAPGRTRRVEFEYRRGGTLAYLAAYDVHHARVIGRCAPSTGIAPFTALVEQVMTTAPYASARRVFWVVDNGSSHNGAASMQRIRDAWPTARLVHLPVHASWLNQVEIYFSIVQRKVVKPQDFPDLTALENRLIAFQNRYNVTAHPFDWRFGRAALHGLLERLDRHEPAA
ncbi:IS630 family transposase [Agromyces bauzanensis]|uniref:IS630 family transposase n=1 Tax=Agromyces bauzanensis TaxID=1308924 RepID=UPI001E44DABC|nr:IS630 family transposase [Agromyces bauzanensis]